MSYTIPNGSLVHIQSTLGADLAVSAASNANPCVMTSTAHGLSNGDEVVVTNGWSKTNARVFRVANVAANTFQLEGLDSTSTIDFPAGGGIGKVNKVTAWTQLQQILDNQTSGGEQQFATYQPLEGDREQRMPTFKTASGWDLVVGDDPTLAGWVLVTKANADGVARAVRISNRNGSKSYFNSYISCDSIPKMTKNEVQTCGVSFSHLAEPTRYAS